MMELQHIRKTFFDRTRELEVLSDIHLSIEQGEMVALVGDSGTGKTTLLQVMGGLSRPTAGSVTVEGKSIFSLAAAQLAYFRNHSVGFMFQFHHLLPEFNAVENVAMPGIIRGDSLKTCTPRATFLLEQMGLTPRMHHLPNELSGGERQRVALARALFNDPAILLADEPTGNLDPRNSEVLLQLLQKANKDLKQTIIMATHSETLAAHAHRRCRIENGIIVAQ
jgi:lipoprotein-releasing system ATP-binding protein